MQNGCHSSHSIWVMSIAEQYGFEDVFQQAVSPYTLLPAHLQSQAQLSCNVMHHFVATTLCTNAVQQSNMYRIYQGSNSKMMCVMQLAAVKGYGLGAILQHFATWESFPECFQVAPL